MVTLVIHAPWYKKDKEGNSVGKPGERCSWETYFKTGVGLGYMLYPDEYNMLNQSPSKVILLRNDKQQQRAEARLTNLKPTGRPAGNGGERYDVYFEDQREIKPPKYLSNEKLTRRGVKVF